MSALPMPKPWSERVAEDAALVAPPEVVADPVEPPAMVALGASLAGLVTPLGERTEQCEQHGTFTARGLRVGRSHPRERWSGCPACVRDAEQAEETARQVAHAQARKAELEESMRRSALPERFIGQTFDTYRAETPGQLKALAKVRAFADDFEAHRRRGTTLTLSGRTGTGKSHLACAVIQAITPRYVGLYVTTMGLIRMVRETWRKGAERSEGQVLEQLADVDLLVVDEVGVQYGTDAEKTLLFEILDRRYLDRKPSILLTNLGLDAFREFVGDRVTDRLREVGRWVPFDWESYRTRKDLA